MMNYVTNLEDFSDKIIDNSFPHIPLHPTSLANLRSALETENRILAFQPTLPITSELGLPPYPVLAYIYPRELSHHWPDIKEKIQSIGHQDKRLPIKVISTTDKDEQIYYFADYYGKAVSPSQVRVILGNNCNLKCVMCPYHSPRIKPTHTTNFFQGKKVMSWELLQKLAKDCGRHKAMVLIGSVEEPLLYPELEAFIALCRQEGVPRVHLTTNGQLLSSERSHSLLEAGLTSLDISLDAATSETYLRIRGGELSQVEANINHFLQWRERLGIDCEVRTSFVRNRDVEFKEEQQFLEKWLTKVNGVFILNCAEYREQNIRLDKDNTAVQNRLQSYLQNSQGRWPCAFPFREIAILPDGRVYYCIETLFRLGFDDSIESLGDYHKKSLSEIWTGELYQQLRKDLIEKRLEQRPVCQTCDMWKSQVISHKKNGNQSVFTTSITEIYQTSTSI